MFISSVPFLNHTGREPQSNAEQQYRTKPYESLQALLLICKTLDQAACSANFNHAICGVARPDQTERAPVQVVVKEDREIQRADPQCNNLRLHMLLIAERPGSLARRR